MKSAMMPALNQFKIC